MTDAMPPGSIDTEFADVNAIRLRAFLDFLHRDHPDADPVKNSELAALLPEHLDRKQWLPFDVEVPLLEKLCQQYSAWSILHRVGREVISDALLYILPHNPGMRTVSQVIAGIPAFVGYFLTLPVCRIAVVSGNQYALEIRYGQHGHANAVDIFFIRGLVTGVLEFINVETAGVILQELPLWPEQIPESEMALLPQIAWRRERTLLSIIVPETSVDNRPRGHEPISLTRHQENARELFVRQVLMRSARLFQDRRELVTAVEYLNMANDELERKIKESEKELDVARNIQRGFIPGLIPDWRGLRFDAFSRPLAGVSGDFYDYFTLEDGRLGILVADVCGHGVPAALISAIAKISFINHYNQRPSDVFSNVNLDILNFVKMEGYLTAFYMTIDRKYNIEYSIAGMPAPLLYRARTNEVVRLQGQGTLLGMFPNASDYFENQDTRLYPGDKLFIFTDGLSEAPNTREEQFGTAALKLAILETASMGPAESTEHLLKRQREFSLGQDLQDDLTVVTLQFNPRYEYFKNYCIKAKQQYSLKKYDEAEEQLRLAIRISPNHPDTLFALCKILVKTKRFEEAIELIQRLLVLRPYHADAYLLMSRCHLGLKRVQQAENDLRRALALRSNNPSALFQLIRVLTRLNKKEEAERHLKALSELRPGDEKVAALRAYMKDQFAT